MYKKLVYMGIALVMLFSLAGLSACDNFDLAAYKTTAKTAIQNHADAKTQVNNYSADGLAEIAEIVTNGKAEITMASDKSAVDTVKEDAIQAINDVPQKEETLIFPSVLEDFNLDEFTEAFFENYTLILVPFEWHYLLYGNLDFYTVFVDNGKLNFLIEVTCPHGGGDEAIDMRMFAVVVPKTIFNNYELGESKIFEAYDFSGAEPAENNRNWLSEIEEKSIEHRVSYVFRGLSFGDYGQLKKPIGDITAISSTQSLQEYFTI